MSISGKYLDQMGGRLTLETGVPISVSDQTAKGTLYYTPYSGGGGEKVCLFDGTNWIFLEFTQQSLDISGYTADLPYDIFMYDNSGTPTIEGLIWTNTITRATALTTQDGVYVKTGATTRRYLGTIMMTDQLGECEDSDTFRGVWNYYNRVPRRLYRTYAASHSYATGAWRPFNNSQANSEFEFVVGVREDALVVYLQLQFNYTAGGGQPFGSLGINTASAASTDRYITAYHTTGTVTFSAGINYDYLPSLGYSYIVPVEYGGAATSPTFVDVAIGATILA